MKNEELIDLAKKHINNSYSKYSNYQVSAALLCKNGNVYIGVNVENAGIQSICAERNAFCCAISDGQREFEKIAIVGRKKNGEFELTLPCGYCRQFMYEFCSDDFKIVVSDEKNSSIKEYNLLELLPNTFKM